MQNTNINNDNVKNHNEDHEHNECCNHDHEKSNNHNDFDQTVDDDKTIALEDELTKTKDQLLRTLAEYENFKKRAEKEKQDLLKFAISNFANDMLSIQDNLQRALDLKKDITNEGTKVLFDGIQLVYSDLENIFKKNGIIKVETIGKTFDPNLHQAVFEVESDDFAQGVVAQSVQDGYVIHERLLRPAMVGVSKGKK